MQYLMTVALVLMSIGRLAAATQPIYINNSPVNSPPDPTPRIDATAFVNRSIFDVNSSSIIIIGGGGLGAVPYQTLNTLYFTNTLSGAISGSPGFRFDYIHDNIRDPMSWWVNHGSISGGTWLLASADNIVSTGPLSAGPAGLIRLEGDNINLSRNGLRTGSQSNVFFGGGSTFDTNYSNPAGVSDVYWGVGTNNLFSRAGNPMALNLGNFVSPFSVSPLHEVVFGFGGFLFTNLVSVGGSNYGAFVYTNRTSASNLMIQIAFVPTNTFDTNLSADVRFFTPGENGGADIAVEFKLRDFDIASQSFETNAIYLVDHSGFVSNMFLARPFFGGAPNRRPGTYELFRFTPFEFFAGTTNNAPYSDSLIYNPSYASNAVTMLYAAYGAQISSATLTNGALPGGSIGDPTNSPGRIEIIGNHVNLDQTRIRAESTVVIKAGELGGGRVARVDAPFLHYDLGSSLLPELVISNLAPATVRRLFGQINAWSAVWENIQITAAETNFIKFHILIVDNFLQTLTPVFINDFLATANHLTIKDNLNIQRNVRINSPGLNITGGLRFPLGLEWDDATVQGLRNFTNSGVIRMNQSAFVGAAPAAALDNYVNSGTNTAASHTIRAANFVNSGCVAADLGALALDATTVSLLGRETLLLTNVFTNVFFNPFTGTLVTNISTNAVTNSFGAKLSSSSDVTISARSMVVSNSYLIADGGVLSLSVDDSLVDVGLPATNRWFAGGGVHMLTLPANSDLLGTHLTSRVRPNGVGDHLWPAVDFGASARGFDNNLALGKLTLDAGQFGLLRFDSVGGAQCALYVDFLELLNFATNDVEAVEIADNLTIYFANASVTPSKIDRGPNGRLRWVRDFAGPMSSTNITYPSGSTYTFNSALVRDKELDSDGDGIVNADDPTPVYAENHVDLRVAFTNAPSRGAVISWFAVGGSTSYVEYKESLESAIWQTLSAVNSGASAERLSFTDPIPSTMQQRFYRVRVFPPPL